MQQHLRSSLFFLFLFFACLVAHGHEMGDTLSIPLKSRTAQLDSLRFSVLPSSLRALDSLVYKSKTPKNNFHLPWGWSEFDDLSKKYLPPLASELFHISLTVLSLVFFRSPTVKKNDGATFQPIVASTGNDIASISFGI